MSKQPTNFEVVMAIWMALAGAADPRTAIELIQALVNRAEPSNPKDTVSVELFLRTVRELDANLEVASGSYAPSSEEDVYGNPERLAQLVTAAPAFHTLTADEWWNVALCLARRLASERV